MVCIAIVTPSVALAQASQFEASSFANKRWPPASLTIVVVIMSSSSDLKIVMSDKHEAIVFAKASVRYKQIIEDYGLPKSNAEIRRIPPNEVLPSPFSRLGRPLNIQYIQCEVVTNIGSDGYQNKRPTPGVVIHRADPGRIARLHKHAANMSKVFGNKLPMMQLNEKAVKECVGGNHLTMALRMYRDNFYCSLSKTRCEIRHDDDLAVV